MGQALDICVHCENKRGCDTCTDLHNWIMEHLEAKQEWISVKDRMPEKMEWVLCACRGNVIEVLRYDHIMDDWDTTMPNRGYFKNFVTHWMPLPEPPERDD